MKFLHKLSDALETATLWIIAAALAAMTVVVFAQVVARELAASLPWSEELSRYLMIYLTYLGISVGVKRKSHIAVEFVTGKFPVKVQNTVETVTNIACIVCCAIIILYGMQLVEITMMQKSPALRIPMGIAYFSLVLGSVLMIIQFIVNTLDTVRDIFNTGSGREVAS
jgi:C4-dicarboxylate transporter DctQ subunit